MKRNLAHYVLGALLLGLGAWFYMNFERVTVREEVGFKGEAARNPLLAFTRLLERSGVTVRASRGRLELDKLEPGATVVLPDNRGQYTRPRAERLLAWVAGGGHLIIEAEPPGRRDTVLDVLKVAREKPSSRAHRTQLAEVKLPRAETLGVYLVSAVTLVDEEPQRTLHVAKDGRGTLVLHLAIGRGRVTVLPSFEPLGNNSIGQYDHAALAWELIRLSPQETRAAVVAPHFEEMSLFAWLAENARAALAATAVVLVVWGWRAASRFGPVAPELPRERRRLLDHLRASGRYLWRTGGAAGLLAAARETCLQKIARTRPALLDLQPGDRAEALAGLTGLSRRDILHALIAEPDTPAAFTAAVSTLQQVEEKLTRKTGN